MALTKWDKTGRVTTLNELAHNLMPACISEVHFILLPFKPGHPVYKMCAFELCVELYRTSMAWNESNVTTLMLISVPVFVRIHSLLLEINM